MATIAGYQRTGRCTVGPGADLVELAGDDGFRHTAVVFHPECRDHPAIGPALDVVRGYLEAPYVTGLLELVAHDRGHGAFIYPTGKVWSANEVVRTLGDLGQVAGIRAGLELMFSAGQVLSEAAESGASHGVYSHGGLTPWRVMLKADGQVEILGYALPQVEILQFQANSSEVPREDSFRYCPPERMEGQGEDLSADLFALALIAFEFMTGKPVYDGLVNDIRTQASRGEGSRRLFRFKDKIPDKVRELLTVCLRAQPEDRFADGDTYLAAVQKVLSGADAVGPSLMDVMAIAQANQRRAGVGLESGKTQGMSREELAQILSEPTETGVEEKRQKTGGERRSWTAPERRARRSQDGSAEPPAPVSEPPASVERDSPTRPEPAPVPVQEDPDETLPPQPPIERPEPTPIQESKSSKWAKPSRGRRRRTKPADLETSGDLEPPNVSAAADAIIQSITSSGDNPAPRQPPRNQRSAADVIEAILMGSTSGDRPSGPEVSEAPGEEPSEPRQAPFGGTVDTESSGAFGAFGAAPPATFGGVAPAEDPLPSSPGLPTVGQAPLGDKTTAPRPADEDADLINPGETTGPGTEVLPLDVASRPVEPEPPLQAEADPNTAPVEPIGGGDTTTHPVPRIEREDPPTLDSEPVERTASALGGPRVHVAPGAAASRRDPDPLPGLAGGKGRAFRILPGPDARPVKMRLPSKLTLAEAVAFLTGTIVPVRTDLQGRVAMGYRLGPASGPANGDTPLTRFKEDSILILHPVPAQERWVAFEVRDGGRPTTFKAPVNTALPAASVVDGICRWLELPAGRWVLHHGDAPIGDHVLLDEVDLDGARLVLKKS